MENPFTVSEQNAEDVLAGVLTHVIAVDGRAVIEKRSNGQSFHMTYRTYQGAQSALGRVRPYLPDAEVIERRP